MYCLPITPQWESRHKSRLCDTAQSGGMQESFGLVRSLEALGCEGFKVPSFRCGAKGAVQYAGAGLEEQVSAAPGSELLALGRTFLDDCIKPCSGP